MGPPYKRGALWDLVDLFDIVIPSPRQRTGVWAGLDIVYVPAGPHAFFRSSGHNNSFYAGPRGQWLSDRWKTHVGPTSFFLLTTCAAVRWIDLQVTSIFIHRVILPVRTSIKMWLTNNIGHVTKLLMPKLNN